MPGPFLPDAITRALSAATTGTNILGPRAAAVAAAVAATLAEHARAVGASTTDLVPSATVPVGEADVLGAIDEALGVVVAAAVDACGDAAMAATAVRIAAGAEQWRAVVRLVLGRSPISAALPGSAA